MVASFSGTSKVFQKGRVSSEGTKKRVDLSSENEEEEEEELLRRTNEEVEKSSP